MNTYRKLVMIPMDVYLGGVQHQQEIVTQPKQPEIATPPLIPMKPPMNRSYKKKKRYKKKNRYKKKTGVVRQLLSSMTNKQLMKITG